MKPSDYLGFYAERLHTVEVDSTFYACPTARTVENWNARTPEGFVFSVKVPQTITHDKVLVDCDAELAVCESAIAKIHSPHGGTGHRISPTLCGSSPLTSAHDQCSDRCHHDVSRKNAAM
jgi:uncharacterized protein YecE (DUF72 family)